MLGVLDMKYRPALVDEPDILRASFIHGSALFTDGILYEALDAGQDRFCIFQTDCQAVAVSFIGELLDIIDGILFGKLGGEASASTTLIAIRVCSRSSSGIKIY